MSNLVKSVFEAVESMCKQLVHQGFLAKGEVNVECQALDQCTLNPIPIIEHFLEEVQNSIKVSQRETANREQIQIKADKKEMSRRISAFMTHKRMEVDEVNLQEFCNRPRANAMSDDSCARVDAVLVKRTDSKSHVKVSRVINQWGPQTVTQTKEMSKQKENESNQNLSSAIEERVNNMETHLKIKSGHTVSKDLFERLRNLENRILFLEGLSPDYFEINSCNAQSHNKLQSRSTNKRSYQALTSDEIDGRIAALKQTLKNKKEVLTL